MIQINMDPSFVLRQCFDFVKIESRRTLLSIMKEEKQKKIIITTH